jgi:hypothetical protein
LNADFHNFRKYFLEAHQLSATPWSNAWLSSDGEMKRLMEECEVAHFAARKSGNHGGGIKNYQQQQALGEFISGQNWEMILILDRVLPFDCFGSKLINPSTRQKALRGTAVENDWQRFYITEVEKNEGFQGNRGLRLWELCP